MNCVKYSRIILNFMDKTISAFRQIRSDFLPFRRQHACSIGKLYIETKKPWKPTASRVSLKMIHGL